MSLVSRAMRLFSPLMAVGFFVKLRQGKPGLGSIARSAAHRASPGLKVDSSSRIVVVGIGPAALACLQELRVEGFANVTVVARDALFGGKCLNIGCMPIEFVLSRAGPVDSDAVRDFTDALRSEAEAAFRELGYPLVEAAAEKVLGQTLHLSTGQTLDFDRLILATGSRFPVPPMLQGQPDLCSIERFWSLAPGSRVTILAEANAAAVALGEVALGMGMAPTVLLSGVNPLFALPSYRFFLARLRERGVVVHEKARLRGAAAGKLVVTVGGREMEIGHDRVVAAGSPQPAFLEIDGACPTLYDLDLTRASLPARPDICFAGDGGGMFTASEAAVQARLLIREWKHGERIDLRQLGEMPFVIHGSTPLAVVGAEWTLFERKWREVDFRQLGWSRISQEQGRVWYMPNAAGDRIEAIHICHPKAADLIGEAAALRSRPIDDLAWLQGGAHPSASEILALVAEHARSLARPLPTAAGAPGERDVQEFRLPDLADIDSGRLPDWLDQDMWQQVALAADPQQVLAAFYGLHRLELASGLPFGRELVRSDAHKWALAGDADTTLAWTEDRMRCQIERGSRRIHIRLA